MKRRVRTVMSARARRERLRGEAAPVQPNSLGMRAMASESTSSEIASEAAKLLRPGEQTRNVLFGLSSASIDGTQFQLSVDHVQLLADYVHRARRVAASALTQKEAGKSYPPSEM